MRPFFLRHRASSAIVIAAALVLRALIPSGMMPAVNAAGAISVVICDGHGGALRLNLPLSDKPVAPADHPCPYVALGHALLAPPPVLPVAETPLQASELSLAAVLVFALGPAPRLRPPSRAPPAEG